MAAAAVDGEAYAIERQHAGEAFGDLVEDEEGHCPRKTRKARKLAGHGLWSGQDSLVLNLWVVTEVHQQSKLMAGCTEIVQDLGAMFIRQRGDGLDFNDDFIVTDKIGL